MITGGGAGDALFGGGGRNTFVYTQTSDSTPADYDIIHDFKTGQDVLDLTALSPSNVSILHFNGGDFVIGGTAQGGVRDRLDPDHQRFGPARPGRRRGRLHGGRRPGRHLIGSAGDDSITGGAGNDIIIGGAGTDIFRYLNASDSTLAAPDIIHDFTTGVDKIDLTAIHAGSANAAYGIAYSAAGSFLYVDQGGDGVNDMLLEVTNPNLQA